MEILKQIKKQISGLVIDHPEFGTILMRLDIKEDLHINAMSTNGVELKFRPNFIHSITHAELTGVLAHAAMHIALCHHLRQGKREHSKWNEACDYAINSILLQSGFTLPRNSLIGHYDNVEAETIYNALPTKTEEEERKSNSNFGNIEPPKDENGKEMEQAALSQQAAEMKIQVAQALALGQSMGTINMHVARVFSKSLEPVINWKEALQRFIHEIVKNDYNWMRPNSRYAAQGIYLPSLYNKEISNIIIAVDTSGSMSKEALNKIEPEIQEIIKLTQSEATIIYCNAAIQKTETFTPQNEFKFTPIGGGGTDFKPPFEYVEKEGITPSCLIYITDGQCYGFPDTPNYPVLWAITGARNMQMPFGEVITLC